MTEDDRKQLVAWMRDYVGPEHEDMRRAADEIERLSAALAAAVRALTASEGRLRDKTDELHSVHAHMNHLRREVERLSVTLFATETLQHHMRVVDCCPHGLSRHECGQCSTELEIK